MPAQRRLRISMNVDDRLVVGFVCQADQVIHRILRNIDEFPKFFAYELSHSFEFCESNAFFLALA